MVTLLTESNGKLKECGIFNALTRVLINSALAFIRSGPLSPLIIFLPISVSESWYKFSLMMLPLSSECWARASNGNRTMSSTGISNFFIIQLTQIFDNHCTGATATVTNSGSAVFAAVLLQYVQ